MMEPVHDAAAEARLLISCLDLTNLNDTCSEADVDRLIERAETPDGPVAAICIWPRFVAHARPRLPLGIRLATVVNFPHGGEDVEATCREAEKAAADGADEIDLVVSYPSFLRHEGGGPDFVRLQVSRVKEAAGGRTLKAILETGELVDPALIAAAGEAALAGGADFLKTSTGKTATSATPASARILLETIRRTGWTAGVKPSGGIKSFEDAAGYHRLANEVMGPDWAGPETFRLGASGVLDDLLAVAGAGPRELPTAGY
jgi:deoxyribose-phosphate aldolase